MLVKLQHLYRPTKMTFLSKYNGKKKPFTNCRYIYSLSYTLFYRLRKRVLLQYRNLFVTENSFSSYRWSCTSSCKHKYYFFWRKTKLFSFCYSCRSWSDFLATDNIFFCSIKYTPFWKKSLFPTVDVGCESNFDKLA